MRKAIGRSVTGACVFAVIDVAVGAGIADSAILFSYWLCSCQSCVYLSNKKFTSVSIIVYSSKVSAAGESGISGLLKEILCTIN